MKLRDAPPLHLTYCLNVHPGERWEQNLASIRTEATRVRDAVADGREFGLGLRLGARAVEDLLTGDALARFADVLAAERMYAFTVNGFPYGTFHGTRVKQDVYAPDWRTPERRDYTLKLAEILAVLLPVGVSGSISTVPVAYRPWIADRDDLDRAASMLAQTVEGLERLHQRTGRDLCLALEPEPDCYVETLDETARLLGELVDRSAGRLKRGLLPPAEAEKAARRRLGVCLDAAHAAVEFEDLPLAAEALREEGLRIAKVQLSAALRAWPRAEDLDTLAAFCDETYLHQVKIKRGGHVLSWADLPEAIAEARAHPDRFAADDEWRIHFHVPLFFESGAVEPTAGPAGAGCRNTRRLGATTELLTGRFAQLLNRGLTEHLEIETYTFGVLPDFLAPADVTDGIIREYRWVLERLPATKEEQAGPPKGHRQAG